MPALVAVRGAVLTGGPTKKKNRKISYHGQVVAHGGDGRTGRFDWVFFSNECFTGYIDVCGHIIMGIGHTCCGLNLVLDRKFQ